MTEVTAKDTTKEPPNRRVIQQENRPAGELTGKRSAYSLRSTYLLVAGLLASNDSGYNVV